MNPDLLESIVAAAFADDHAHVDAEYGSDGTVKFRSDVEAFVAREVVDACVMDGRFEISPQPNVKYTAFVDPSGGSNDSMTLAIAHEDKKGRVVVDVCRERRAPFDPDEVVREFADVLKPYRVSAVCGDRYAGE